MPPIEIAYDVLSRSDWERLLGRADRPAFEQCWAYGAAVAEGGKAVVRRAVVSLDGRPCALVQGIVRRFGGVVTVTQILRGPVLLAPARDRESREAVFRAIRNGFRRGWHTPLLWIPELPDAPASHALMRAIGARRVVTGYSSAWVDLALPQDELRRRLHGKWRNALRRAERNSLRVRHGAGGRAFSWLWDHYSPPKRARRFAGRDADLLRRAAEKTGRRDDFLVLQAGRRRDPNAGILLVRHGAAATYLVGWTDEEGRRAGAHNLLLWRGLLTLKERGVRWLDLGGFNTETMAGIARFKLGVGGEVYTLAGTFL